MKDLRTAALIAPIEVPATILNVDLPFLPSSASLLDKNSYIALYAPASYAPREPPP